MRNLVPLEEALYPVASGQALLTASNSLSGSVYVVTEKLDVLGFCAEKHEVEFVCRLREISPDIPETESIIPVGLQYVQELESLVFALSSGQIITLQVPDLEADCVGSVESGIQCMAWSPDQEVVVFVSADFQLLIMTKQWELLSQVQLSAVPYPTGTASLNWKADGKNFVCLLDQGGSRVLHIYTREGLLQSVSEQGGILGLCASWRPAGNVIAVPISNLPEPKRIRPQPSSNNPDPTTTTTTTTTAPPSHIGFYESNGLRHGSFKIRYPTAAAVAPMEVSSIAWSPQSDVLALVLAPSGGGASHLQLWHVDNYYWYLKYERPFGTSITTLYWEAESPYRLFLSLKGQGALRLDFCLEYTVSDQGTVAVIDGASVQVTSLKHTVIPPPMYSLSVPLPRPANLVAWSHLGSLASLLSDGSLIVHDLGASQPHLDGVEETLKTLPTLSLSPPSDLDLSSARHLLHPSSDSAILILPSTTSTATDSIVQVWARHDAHGAPVLVCHTTPLPALVPGGRRTSVHRVAFSNASGRLLLHLSDGSMYLWTPSASPDVTPAPPQLFEPWKKLRCSALYFFTPAKSDQEVALGLTASGKLQLNGTTLATDATSFALHDRHLLYITRHSVLKIFPFSASSSGHFDLDELGTLTSKPADQLPEENLRAVERGARLVCAVRDDVKVVTQLPRGNLETIYPRALVTSAIEDHLSQLQYREAFLLARQHRVDLNLLYDHDPDKFLKHSLDFVKQLASTEHINLFLSSLRDSKVAVAGHAKSVTAADNDKINVICDTVRAALQSTDPDRYVSCIITALVKKHPPEVEEALSIIRVKREREVESLLDATANGPSDNNLNAEDALEHLNFLCDVNKVFDVALGLYDLDLALMVAQKSQKDPKEYLPFLASLQQLEPNPAFQRYTIDKHLKRFDKALTNLSVAGPEHFAECLSMIKEHKLYELGCRLFNGREEQWRAVVLEHATYLQSTMEYQRAAHAFVACSDQHRALECFQKANDWRSAFALASRMALPEPEVLSLAHDLAESLRVSGRLDESAIILREYCGELDRAVQTLVHAESWMEASRLERVQPGASSVVVNGVQEAAKVFREELGERLQKYKTKLLRLQIVRDNKAAMPLLDSGQDALDQDGRDDDAASEFSDMSGASVSSVASSSSTTSTRSSSSVYSFGQSRSTVSTLRQGKVSQKAQRRRDRKGHRIKEGHPKEESHLIEELGALVPTPEFLGRIRSLLEALVFHQCLPAARLLQSETTALLSYIAAHPVPEASPDPPAAPPPISPAVPVLSQSWHLDFL